jgi:putative hydrolase of the HAD superfamily
MDERDRFIALIKNAAVELRPQLPSLPEKWNDLLSAPHTGKYKALLFDVYGTLFCSAAGEISARETGNKVVNPELDALAKEYGPRLSGETLRAFFVEKVCELHQTSQVAWPEVRVEQIWESFLSEHGLEGSGRELALRYEIAVNPVCPMPDAAQTIAALKADGCVMGIVSNAQFFTPLLFEALLGGSPEQLGFDSRLLIWSYEYGEAKPSATLFNAAAERLKERGIEAADCAFVGNDMLSDVYGAMGAGFQGILFAGDTRSLRLREGNPFVGHLHPARIIRSLAELAE